jgi:Ca2+-binding RTX toxin-like protein
VAHGGDGKDTVKGNDGNDFLDGNDGDDKLKGGNGKDVLQGGNDDDTLYGGADRDCLYGEAGNDRLDGGTGGDFLDGGNGNDTLFGGAGDYNDFLKGGLGRDRLYGGDGKDVFIIDLEWDGAMFSSNDGNDTIHDFDIDQDHDVLLFRVTTVGAGAGTSAQDAFAALDGGGATVADNGTDTLISAGGATVNILGLTGREAPFTSLGQDAIPIGGVGINAVTTGDAGSYEAIRVLTSDTGFDDSYDNIWGPTAV